MRFYQSLFILGHNYETITFLSTIMIDNNINALDPKTCDEKSMFHYLALFKSSIIEACSFLEEYDDNFEQKAEIEFKERIRFVKTSLKPVLRKVRCWKDLRKVRNELMAHPWRGKGNTFVYPNIFNYDSPRNFWQLQELRTCIGIMIALIGGEFDEEITATEQYMNSIQPVETPPITNLNILEELKGIIEQVNINCANNNKHYRLDPKILVG